MARPHAVARCAGRLRLPPRHGLRPVQMARRIEAFLAEVRQESVADGLVERCPGGDGDGPDYRLTPAGREWLRGFPAGMLDCAQRSRSASTSSRPPPSPRGHPRRPTNKAV